MKSLTLLDLQITDPCLSQSHLAAPALQNFDEQSLFCTYFPSSLGEAPPDDRVVLPNTQAASRIFLIISLCVAEAICLKDMGKIQARIKLHVRQENEGKQRFITLPGVTPPADHSQDSNSDSLNPDPMHWPSTTLPPSHILHIQSVLNLFKMKV